MFSEYAKKPGWIEVICGSMFSGKTEELIRRLKRAKFANQRVEIFKPGIDTRYSVQEVVSHDATAILSTPVESSASILLLSGDVDVVGIDEAQFFDDGIVDVCRQLASSSHSRRPGHGLPGKTVRSHAGSYGRGRIRGQGTCHLRALWRPRPVLAPPVLQRPPGGTRGEGYLRASLPPLLQ